MRRLAYSVVLAFAFGTAQAQEAPDCTVGRLIVGGPAPEIRETDYLKAPPSEWFMVLGAKHYRPMVKFGSIPYDPAIAIKDGKLVAITREFKTKFTAQVLAALHERYGEPVKPNHALIPWTGDCHERGQQTWFDEACGLRIDAFPSIDPEDPDERTVIVWTAATNPPAAPVTPALDAIR